MGRKVETQIQTETALCYGKLGQKAPAIQALDMALEFDKNYEPAIVIRAIVESLLEGEKFSPDKVDAQPSQARQCGHPQLVAFDTVTQE